MSGVAASKFTFVTLGGQQYLAYTAIINNELTTLGLWDGTNAPVAILGAAVAHCRLPISPRQQRTVPFGQDECRGKPDVLLERTDERGLRENVNGTALNVTDLIYRQSDNSLWFVLRQDRRARKKSSAHQNRRRGLFQQIPNGSSSITGSLVNGSLLNVGSTIYFAENLVVYRRTSQTSVSWRLEGRFAGHRARHLHRVPAPKIDGKTWSDLNGDGSDQPWKPSSPTFKKSCWTVTAMLSPSRSPPRMVPTASTIRCRGCTQFGLRARRESIHQRISGGDPTTESDDPMQGTTADHHRLQSDGRRRERGIHAG